MTLDDLTMAYEILARHERGEDVPRADLLSAQVAVDAARMRARLTAPVKR